MKPGEFHDPALGRVASQLLADQQTLPAVESFSVWHEEHGRLPHSGIKRYRNLIPLTAPAPGQQYAFEVNLDQCTGCKACVAGCHSMNGLDGDETWRDVGVLKGKTASGPLVQTITSACHHCLEPACAQGCPTLAYDKDPQTGVVIHLDDQCIGCHYCEIKCPYGVPKYNERLGIVRKCDMCHSRLAAGEAPACVQSCPNSAIRITLVEAASVAEDPEDFVALPGAPSSQITKPTTRYSSLRPLPHDLQTSSGARLEPQHVPWSLVILLVASQMSVGVLAASLVQFGLGQGTWHMSLMASLGLLLVSMVAAPFHLGRPMQGFRALLGWRRSWLSRELLAMGAYLPLLASALFPWPHGLQVLVMLGALLAGLVLIACSSMIYIDTPRELWKSPLTALDFYLTALIGTWGTFLVSAICDMSFLAPTCYFFAAGLALSLCKTRFSEVPSRATGTTRRMLEDRLQRAVKRRTTMVVFACLVLPIFAISLHVAGIHPLSRLLLASAIILLVSAELQCRSIFFAAAVPPRMPGMS